MRHVDLLGCKVARVAVAAVGRARQAERREVLLEERVEFNPLLLHVDGAEPVAAGRERDDEPWELLRQRLDHAQPEVACTDGVGTQAVDLACRLFVVADDALGPLRKGRVAGVVLATPAAGADHGVARVTEGKLRQDGCLVELELARQLLTVSQPKQRHFGLELLGEQREDGVRLTGRVTEELAVPAAHDGTIARATHVEPEFRVLNPR